MRRKPWVVLAASVMPLIAVSCGGGQIEPPPDLAQAQAAARERGVPLLLDFYTDW